MVRRRGGSVRLWRLRSNPLRRRCDVVEAWVVLAAWVIALVGGVLAGAATACHVERGLDAQRAQRHAVAAVLTTRAPTSTSPLATDNGRVWASVRWTAPDGSTHVGRAPAVPGARAGTQVMLWTDKQGRPTTPPLSPGGAAFQASWTGALAGLTAAGAVLGCARVVRFQLERRRLDEWAAEWERVSARWGRTTG